MKAHRFERPEIGQELKAFSKIVIFSTDTRHACVICLRPASWGFAQAGETLKDTPACRHGSRTRFL
jgi:hypothetical protein